MSTRTDGIDRNAEEHDGTEIFYAVARIPLDAHGIQHASSCEQTGLNHNHAAAELHASIT
jgi:hypothetical protein